MARMAFDLAERQGINLTLLDIGGGFPGWDGSEFVYEATSEAAAVTAEESFPTSSPETAAEQHLGVGDDGEDISTPRPPLSLADIAEVTIPVLDDLFPPGSGVQVLCCCIIISTRLKADVFGGGRVGGGFLTSSRRFHTLRLW